MTRGSRAVEPQLPAEQATQVLSATGKLVLPGLVDLHAHVFPQASGLGLPADEQIVRAAGFNQWASKSGWRRLDLQASVCWRSSRMSTPRSGLIGRLMAAVYEAGLAFESLAELRE